LQRANADFAVKTLLDFVNDGYTVGLVVEDAYREHDDFFKFTQYLSAMTVAMALFPSFIS
jgi:hypothetical protein